MNSYYETLAAMRARAQMTNVTWSEPYVSIPNIWGKVASAVTPVYDKSQEPWLFLGVAAADLPVCLLEEAAAAEAKPARAPTVGETVQGCSCERSFTYQGQSLVPCTSFHWNTGWCGTVSCGVCDGQVISRTRPAPNHCALLGLAEICLSFPTGEGGALVRC